MLLTSEKIKNIFERFLNQKISREEVDDWANRVIKERNKNNLIVLPLSMEKKIWSEGIMYLITIYNQESKGIYDQSIEDIKKFYENKWLHNNEIDNQVETVAMDVAIDIDDNWVQCSNQSCQEVFTVSNQEKYLECPKCLKIQLNPQYFP